jgi:hypothetical protein
MKRRKAHTHRILNARDATVGGLSKMRSMAIFSNRFALALTAVDRDAPHRVAVRHSLAGRRQPHDVLCSDQIDRDDRMMTALRLGLARVLAVGLLVALAGCATSQMSAEWRDATFAAGSLKGGRVLVVCRAPDEALRRVCEDQWTSQLGARGIAAVQSYSIAGFPWASGDTSDEMKAAVRASGVVTLASMSIYPSEVASVNPGPQVGIGIGGGSGGGYRGGGFSVGGIGITLPIGGAIPTQSLAASSSLVDAASGKLVWSGSASTPASGDVIAQVSALSQITILAIRRAALL